MQSNMVQVHYSRGKSKFDNRPEQRVAGSFDEFEAAVLSDRSTQKGMAFICAPLGDGLHYQKPDKFHGIAHWRLRDYVKPRCFLPFDIDWFATPDDFNRLKEVMKKYRGFGYTTASHTEMSPRARLILQASRPVNNVECVSLCESLESEILACLGQGAAKFDRSVYRGEQPVYTPLVGSNVFRFVGDVVDVDSHLETHRVSHGNLLEALAVNPSFAPPIAVSDGEGRELTILKLASSLRAKSVDQNLIEQMCLSYNHSSLRPPLSEEVVLDRARRYQSFTPLASQNPETWPKPEQIKTSQPPVPEFDESLLPEGFRAWVSDIAERMQCLVEYLAVGAMVAAGAALGNRIGIQPKQRDTGWVEVPNIWGAVVGRPGVMKSPALSQILAPLRRIESGLLDEYTLTKAQYEINRMAYEATKKKLSALMAKGDVLPPDMLPAEPQMPQPKRLIVNDATYQKLGQVLSGNPHGLLVFQDELSGMLRRLDSEGQEAARAFYLEAWDGKQGYTFDRVERGTVRIPQLCFSMLGGLQPSKLREYLKSAIVGGTGDDGLAQRLQMLVYPDIKKEWVQVDRPLDIAAAAKAEAVFDRLVKIDPLSVGAVQQHCESIPVLRFDPQAQDLFNKWWAHLENSLRKGDRHPALESHLSKYRKLVPAIALLDHLIRGETGNVGIQSVKLALRWHLFLFAHAERCYAVVTSSVLDSAKLLAQHVKNGDLSDGFTIRDVYRKGWSQLAGVKEASEAIEVLVDSGWLRGVRDEKVGAAEGKPTVRYLINPALKEAA